MAGVREVRRRRKGGLTNTALVQRVREFVILDREVKQIEGRKKDLRKDLLRWAEENGYVDDKGNQYLDLPEEVEGVRAVKRERVVSQSFDWDGALRLVREKGLTDCVKTVEVLDEDAFAAALYEKRISDQEYMALKSESESWRLKMVAK